MGASASFDSSSIPVEPGGQAEVRLRVRNTGTIVDSFTFQPVGVPAEWVTVTPPELRLFPETEEFVTVTVTPPRSADTPIGELTFALRVISAEDPEGSVAEELTLVIGEFAQRGGELHPKTSTGRTKGVHELAVDNFGNAPITASFVGIDPDDLLAIEIKPPSETVRPGTAAIATVTVRPRKRFWRGQPKTLPFQVAVTQGDQEPTLLDGNFVQQPMIPKWLWKALLALLLLLILLWVLWQTLLKPTVESTARDSVEELVDERDEAIDERLDAAGIPELGGGPAPGGATTTTIEEPAVTTTTVVPATTEPGATTVPGTTETTTVPTTTAPPITGLGTTDFRIEVTDVERGGAAVAAQAVADGTQLEITDIVFQNPTGAQGELAVLRDDDVLFVVQMANFRDLDYHFVAPYVFEAGESVRVRMVCITQGVIEPRRAPAGTCEASVSFAGFRVAATG